MSPGEDINTWLHEAELALDSVTQSMLKCDEVLLWHRRRKHLKQLFLALGRVRRCQKFFPQKNYTLTRCMNKDELPSMERRSYARTDWHEFKRRQRAEREQQALI